jgi:hypothetical protein
MRLLDRVSITRGSPDRSGTRLPPRWVLAPVDREHNDVFAGVPEVDRIRESGHDPAASLPMYAWTHSGTGGDSTDEFVERLTEFLPEPLAPRLVPRLDLKYIVCGLGPEDDLPRGHLRAEFRADVGPRHGRFRISEVFGPPTIKLCPLVVGQHQISLALAIGQALPQRHGELGPVAGWQLEQVDERT